MYHQKPSIRYTSIEYSINRVQNLVNHYNLTINSISYIIWSSSNNIVKIFCILAIYWYSCYCSLSCSWTRKLPNQLLYLTLIIIIRHFISLRSPLKKIAYLAIKIDYLIYYWQNVAIVIYLDHQLSYYHIVPHKPYI
jgi:hypothetical protein